MSTGEDYTDDEIREYVDSVYDSVCCVCTCGPQQKVVQLN